MVYKSYSYDKQRI